MLLIVQAGSAGELVVVAVKSVAREHIRSQHLFQLVQKQEGKTFTRRVFSSCAGLGTEKRLSLTSLRAWGKRNAEQRLLPQGVCACPKGKRKERGETGLRSDGPSPLIPKGVTKFTG